MVNQSKILIQKTASILNEQREISKLKGENFNIFSILKVESKEEQTHSNFIAELLNPNGSHELGDVFLREFLKIINFDEIWIEDVQNVEVFKEHVFNDGRLDILVKSNSFSLVIENKIYAGDGFQQLMRYHNYIQYSNAKYKKVLYLTLDGKEASEQSHNGLKKGEDYYLISYSCEIRTWLELCVKEAAEYPILRETIRQYLILINKLTGNLTNHKMEEKLYDVITQDIQSFEAAHTISTNFNETVNKLKKVQLELLESKFLTVNKNRLEPKDLSFHKSKRSDGLFIRLKSYNINNQNYDLGLNIELDNNYYFFCIAEEGEARSLSINTNPDFNIIREEIEKLDFEFDKPNGYSIAKSSSFEIGIDRLKYFYPATDNNLAFKLFVERVTKEIIDKFKP